jgi:hypothetical protein
MNVHQKDVLLKDDQKDVHLKNIKKLLKAI